MFLAPFTYGSLAHNLYMVQCGDIWLHATFQFPTSITFGDIQDFLLFNNHEIADLFNSFCEDSMQVYLKNTIEILISSIMWLHFSR